MAETTSGNASSNVWHRLALALLAAIIVESVLVYIAAVLQAPIPPPPVKAAPFFVWNATVAAAALPLLYWDEKFGYAGGVIVGLLTIVGILLVGTGRFGPLDPNTNPVGPLLYLALGFGLLVATVAAWRGRTEPDVSAGASPASQ